MVEYIRYKDYFGADLIDWNIEEFCGYKPISTYYTDFGIAERFGELSILETFENAVKYWGEDIKWMTEIVMVLNWKQWKHHGISGNDKLVELYYRLQQEATKHILDNFKDEEDLRYFYSTTD